MTAFYFTHIAHIIIYVSTISYIIIGSLLVFYPLKYYSPIGCARLGVYIYMWIRVHIAIVGTDYNIFIFYNVGRYMYMYLFIVYIKKTLKHLLPS